jgi:hypothetical protein
MKVGPTPLLQRPGAAKSFMFLCISARSIGSNLRNVSDLLRVVAAFSGKMDAVREQDADRFTRISFVRRTADV